MKTKNLTTVAIVAVIAIVGLLNIANAVPGAGKSGNPPGVQPATELQNLVDCCQSQATVAEYQDNAPTNQVMGTCTKAGITAFRTGGLPALQNYINNTACGACETNAAGLVCGEDDGNSCTTGFCSTGLRPGCILGTAVDRTPCGTAAGAGVCVSGTCSVVPVGVACTSNTDCVSQFCTQNNACISGFCSGGSNPCPLGTTCNEVIDACI